jgi:hypothetical protein
LLNLPAKAVPIYNLPAFSENVTVTRNVTKGEGMLKIASNKSGQKQQQVGPGQILCHLCV